MKLIVIDFETFWSAQHSLTKMSPILYTRDADTELQTLGVKIDNDPTFVLVGEAAMRDWVQQTDFSDALLVGHNMSGFDSMLCAWRLGIRPKMWGCTLAMARELGITRTQGGSLKRVAEYFGLPSKLDLEATNTKGRRLGEFSKEELHALIEYNKVDVDICHAAFKRMAKRITPRSLKLIDVTIRMLVEPQFRVDRSLIKITLKQVAKERDDALLDIGRTVLEAPEIGEEAIIEHVRQQLASAPKFAALLEALNVEVPMKPSPSNPEKMIPALAKTDEAMTELLSHEDTRVAAAAAARLQVKSVQLETRLQSFLEVAESTGGWMPIALNYYGAENSGRWSGAMSLNHQNLPRIGKQPKHSDTLRRCLRALKGHKVVVADLSGIELRMNHFLWKVPSSMELFRKDPAKADLYRAFASKLYYVPEDKVTPHQRMLGKIGQLQLQYGSGAAKFRDVARLWGAPMSEDEATKIVYAWREMYAEIVYGWRRCSDALRAIAMGSGTVELDPWGLCKTVKYGIKTPRGQLYYPNLRYEDNQWVYDARNSTVKIYGAKLVENCLAADTLVLTDRGWKRIQSILSTDRVYDGVEFVDHGGTVFKSVQPCVTVDGVLMTADHKVLTDEGWKTASQIQRLDGPALRYADRDPSFAQHWEKMEMGVPVRLREYMHQARQCSFEGSEARRDAQLRVRNSKADWEQKQAARYVEAPSVCRVAQHGGSLQAALASSVGKLRRAWNKSLRFVAGVVRELLGRHGRGLHAWAYAGPSEQQRRLHPEQLPVENSKRAEQKPARFNPRGGYTRAVETDRHIAFDSVLSAQPWQAADRCSRQAQSYEVYDIVNAGPRHRFVVLGAHGPFIVHNCIQHLSREAMADMILEISKRYKIAHTVHDEIVLVVPEEEAEEALAFMQECMRRGVAWFPELITWSEGGIGDNYGDAKS